MLFETHLRFWRCPYKHFLMHDSKHYGTHIDKDRQMISKRSRLLWLTVITYVLTKRFQAWETHTAFPSINTMHIQRRSGRRKKRRLTKDERSKILSECLHHESGMNAFGLERSLGRCWTANWSKAECIGFNRLNVIRFRERTFFFCVLISQFLLFLINFTS